MRRESDSGRGGALPLELALATLERRYGKGAVRLGGEPAQAGLATGVGPLDELFPGGGLPRGRLSLFSGVPGQGVFDLSLALLAIISRSFPVAVVDFGKQVDPGDINAYGGDLDSCWVVRPRHQEEGWAAARSLTRAGVGLCLLLAPEWGRVAPAAPTALLTAAEERGAVVLLSGGAATGEIGGRLAIEIAGRRLQWTTAHGDVSGLHLELQVVRSRLGPPGRSCFLQVDFPRPYASRPGIAEAAVESGGGWVTEETLLEAQL